MKYLCHAVLHRGIVYYNTIIQTIDGKVLLSPYREEEEATVFINGIIAVLDAKLLQKCFIDELRDVVDDSVGIEDTIDAIIPYIESKQLFISDEIRCDSVLLAISPDIRVL